MSLDPEKIAFYIAGFKKCKVPLSDSLPKEQMVAVSNFWLARSNTSTVFSTIFLTLAIVLFVETKNWLFFTLFFGGAILSGIRVRVYQKCAYHALKLWT